MRRKLSEASDGAVQYVALRQALAHVRSNDDFRHTKRLGGLLEHLVMKVAQARASVCA